MFSDPKQQIQRLVAKYQNLPPKVRKTYHEANTKNVFVQPLFESLDWDFSDINQVEAEKTIVKGRVDFVCKLSGVSKFCLEVKPLREDLTDDDRKQAISYAYNKGVTWAVLTNFDKLQVFNAEREATDLNSVLFLNLTWQNYLTDFDDLWLLSRESVASSLLDKQAAKYGKLPARVPIEKRLYQHLREYRERLFNEIYYMHKDKGITLATTDSLIQALFNRLLFIRTAEDRDLAGNHPLLAALHRWRTEKKEDLIEHIRGIFHNFVELYDSDLFPVALDPWEQIWVSSDLLSEVIQGLYEVPGDFARYDFSVIDADVLGQVYEQYLGYVAQVAKEQAKEQQLRLEMGIAAPEVIKLEEKKKRRKAAGIYYTPRWVTDYIVKQTVGRFLQDKSYGEVLNMKVLDPACGSGSFLIRAYDELLSYHAKIKGKNVADLDWAERIKVLTKNIFGVDLDPHAVEITRLNLLLRALAKIESLPSLANNIQCGNSLISGSDEEIQQCLGDNFRDYKPFNWEERFSDIMGEGGFDIVISNPPYVSFGLRGVEKIEANLALYLKQSFPNSAEYKLSTYALFIDRGLQLLKDGGYLGYIVPDSFLLGRFFSKLRRSILDRCAIKEIVLFAKDFWASGTVGLPVIIVAQKLANEKSRKRNKLKASLCGDLTELKSGSFTKDFSYEQNYFEGVMHSRFRLFFDKFAKDFVEKIETGAVLAKEIVSIHTGVRSKIGQSNVTSKEQKNENWQRGLISGSEIGRYFIEYAGNYINIDPQLLWSGGWDKEIISQPKLLMRQTGDSLITTLDENHYYHLNNLHSIIIKNRSYSLKYILGILNSKLMNHYYHLITLEKGRTMAQTDIETIELLPIRRIDFDNLNDRKKHRDLVKLVDNMLELSRKLAVLKAESKDIFGEEAKELESEIAKTDQKIDQLVYQLYGITEEERQMIEASLSSESPNQTKKESEPKA